MENVNYNEVFKNAKDITVYSHAIVWIQHVMENKEISERTKFNEIYKIVNEANDHLSE